MCSGAWCREAREEGVHVALEERVRVLLEQADAPGVVQHEHTDDVREVFSLAPEPPERPAEIFADGFE